MASSRKLYCRGTARRAPTLTDRIAARLAPLLSAHSSILIGLSGGVDSVVLLHLLHQLAPRFSWQLSALHVHHGISPNADAWADFCAGLCAQHAIPLHIEHVDIAPLRKHGIEAAARKLRHAAFARQACDFIALAHHADDQAETLLLQLLRGSGVRGASAMPVLSQVEGPLLAECKSSGIEFSPVRPDPSTMLRTKGIVEGCTAAKSKLASTGSARTESKNVCAGSIVRPLLHCSRQEILDYAAAENLQWIEDESNTDDSYPRNFLRHRLLPLLGQKFPAYRDTLTRSAQHFAEAGVLLDDLAQLDAPDLFPSPSGGGARGEGGELRLEVSRLQSLSQPRAKNLLRYFLHSIGAPMPQTVQLDDMLHQLCGARQDAAVCIAYGDWQVHRYQGRVYALRALREFDRSLVLPWHGEAELDWPVLAARLCFNQTQGAGISLAKLQHAPVTLRLRNGGETLRPNPHAATRTLKNLLQEHHVPPWQRDRLPLLYCGEELACVPGVAIAAGYQASVDEAGISLGLLY
ncbi:MAG TPA: tRNA lysidine(34) synthetase TilS [Gallionella sp.]|nr:tRNA lysidine(34) synthetase TilS [Gallionella sp.]